jgi:uncharacterized protein with HEPN domain
MQPEDRDAAHLWDILQAAREISQFVAGMRFHEYEKSNLVQAAVERKVEIIGEAAGRLSVSLRSRHPAIPWKAMIAQRNVIAHDYGEILQERLWRVATERIPELIEMIEPLVPSPPGEQ